MTIQTIRKETIVVGGEVEIGESSITIYRVSFVKEDKEVEEEWKKATENKW